MKDYNAIKIEFRALSEMLFMLYRNHFRCDDELKQIHQLSEEVYQMIPKVDEQEIKVKKDRDDLE